MDSPKLPPLPKLDSIDLTSPIAPDVLVTFLNKTLKRRGLVFGYSRTALGVHLTVYEGEPWQGSEREVT